MSTPSATSVSSGPVPSGPVASVSAASAADADATGAGPADAALIAALVAATARDVVLDGLADRLAFAGDASIYHLVPQVVVLARHADDLAAVLDVARRHRIGVTLRAGGTSLSGQGVGSGILLVVSRFLRRIVVAPDGNSVHCEPGAVGAFVNAALARHGRRIGPDPASIQAAEIGGIVANNASGMCCGIAENSYRTVIGLDLVLADGFRISTDADDADVRLSRERPQLHAGLIALRDRIRGSPSIAARLRAGFSRKNTVGYRLDAFLDADAPAAILRGLIVGSEGTLAAIAAARFRTVVLPRVRATAWLVFADVESAAEAVRPLAELGAAAIEILDAASLACVAAKLPQAPPPGEPAALLVEFQEADEAALSARIAAAAPVLSARALAGPAAFSRDPALQERLWAIRKGLFPSVGAIRAAGSSVVIEDVTFPVEGLAAGVRCLRRLFAAHGYADAVIFGHAKDGNLHFTLTPDFAAPGAIAGYDRFLREMVEVVLAAGGSLKAEHGTGRNMAPFVAAQWGDGIAALMREVKTLLDPHGVLNPGVLLSADPQAHLRHLKALPPAHPLIDRCMECGFCEPVCPSRDLTRTPRQRIATLRAIVRAPHSSGAAALRQSFAAEVLDSCAGDGTCATACPVGIDTGALVRAERAARRPAWQTGLALRAAGRIGLLSGLARGALHLFGGRRLPRHVRSSNALRLPKPAPPLPRTWPQAEPGAPTVLYVPSCLTRTMRADDADADSIAADFAALCALAGIGVVVPETALCCGQPFASKGFPAAAARCARDLAAACVQTAAQAGAVQPLLCLVTDTSTCASALNTVDDALREAGDATRNATDERGENAEKTRGISNLATSWRALPRVHPAAFLADTIVPRLLARGRIQPHDFAAFVLHPTCSETGDGVVSALCRALPGATLPRATACCGMAGDRGFAVPGLIAAATAREVAAVSDLNASSGACTSLTCAAALSTTGVPYRHLFSVLRVACRESPGIADVPSAARSHSGEKELHRSLRPEHT